MTRMISSSRGGSGGYCIPLCEAPPPREQPRECRRRSPPPRRIYQDHRTVRHDRLLSNGGSASPSRTGPDPRRAGSSRQDAVSPGFRPGPARRGERGALDSKPTAAISAGACHKNVFVAPGATTRDAVTTASAITGAKREGDVERLPAADRSADVRYPPGLVIGPVEREGPALGESGGSRLAAGD